MISLWFACVDVPLNNQSINLDDLIVIYLCSDLYVWINICSIEMN